jgi:hypothetical protein
MLEHLQLSTPIVEISFVISVQIKQKTAATAWRHCLLPGKLPVYHV